MQVESRRRRASVASRAMATSRGDAKQFAKSRFDALVGLEDSDIPSVSRGGNQLASERMATGDSVGAVVTKPQQVKLTPTVMEVPLSVSNVDCMEGVQPRVATSQVNSPRVDIGVKNRMADVELTEGLQMSNGKALVGLVEDSIRVAARDKVMVAPTTQGEYKIVRHRMDLYARGVQNGLLVTLLLLQSCLGKTVNSRRISNLVRNMLLFWTGCRIYRRVWSSLGLPLDMVGLVIRGSWCIKSMCSGLTMCLTLESRMLKLKAGYGDEFKGGFCPLSDAHKEQLVHCVYMSEIKTGTCFLSLPVGFYGKAGFVEISGGFADARGGLFETGCGMG
ncbi:hypothetical protein V6N11_008169 [Hibiscus sabdariffa]|uniref:Uncharacterized protein n=1 Tax=Hibiscus sabdariffa TaxID=183260 RepID=A0ABR2PZU4_9ROSI